MKCKVCDKEFLREQALKAHENQDHSYDYRPWEEIDINPSSRY